MLNNTPQNSKISVSEIFFTILDVLTKRFNGLSPFEILNTPTSEVLDLYVDTILNDFKEKNKSKGNTWVTSSNATWH